jgi:dihydrolipoamide dehydrogenase
VFGFDVIIIGGGPAGIAAAVRCAQRGAKVALIEAQTLGGTCLNCGCIPTKFLWEALHLNKKIMKCANYGISTTAPTINFADVKTKKDKAISMLVKGVQTLCASHGVTVIEGPAKFIDKNNIEAGAVKYSAAKFIIATGSSPKAVAGLVFDHKTILNSTDVLALDSVPQSLLVVGGGAVGIELAGLMAGFGCAVKLVEREKQLLPNADVSAAEECKKSLERAGVTVALGISSINEHRAGYDKMLVAAGRQPNVETLNLSAAAVTHSEKGISVNEYMETSTQGIFAVGDVTGKNYLAYVAEAEGLIAAENATGKKLSTSFSAVPWALFTDPPIASVGLRTQDIQPQMKEGNFALAANTKAFIEGERNGWVKVITAPDGTILGGTIAGSNAPELITILALAVEKKMNSRELSKTNFFHPSIAESIFSAFENAENKGLAT